MRTRSLQTETLAIRPCRRMVLLAAAFAAALSGNACADELLNSLGGPGGGPFQARCATGEVLTGLELRVGDYVDAVRPLCAIAYGAHRIGAGSSGDWHGGSGGSVLRIACPGDEPIARGLFVDMGIDDSRVVNNMSLHCGEVGSTRSTAEARRPEMATTGLAQACPSGQFAIGVHGRSGAYLDALGLICDVPRFAVGSIGRVNTGASPPSGPPMSICQRAQDARRRNSPAAPNLEAQCLASKSTVTSIGRSHADVALPAATPAPSAPASLPSSPPSSPAPLPTDPEVDDASSRRAARDADIGALIGSVVSSIDASRRDNGQRRNPGMQASPWPGTSNRLATPAWLTARIAEFGRMPAYAAPLYVEKITHNGEPAFFMGYGCCDQYSPLYDYEGRHICSAGGRTGRGDGRCSGMRDPGTPATEVWRNPNARHSDSGPAER